MFDCFQSSDVETTPTESAVVLEHHLLVDTVMSMVSRKKSHALKALKK